MNAKVMGGFNSTLGEGSTNKVVGSFGFGTRDRKDAHQFLQATRSGNNEYDVVYGNANDTVYMGEPRRPKTLPNRLHSCETTLLK